MWRVIFWGAFAGLWDTAADSLSASTSETEGVLDPAYNDRAGVTAAFNLNLLGSANRELGADFNLPRSGDTERSTTRKRTASRCI